MSIIHTGDEVLKIEADILLEVKHRKLTTKRIKASIEEEYCRVNEEILAKYGSFKITDEKMLKKEFSLIFPTICNKCSEFKIFPYDFLSKCGRSLGTNNCNTCMSINTSRNKNCRPERIVCKCGTSYDDTYSGIANHQASAGHIKKMNSLLNGKSYTKKELTELCRLNKIPYYKNLNAPAMTAELKKLSELVLCEIKPIKEPTD